MSNNDEMGRSFVTVEVMGKSGCKKPNYKTRRRRSRSILCAHDLSASISTNDVTSHIKTSLLSVKSSHDNAQKPKLMNRIDFFLNACRLRVFRESPVVCNVAVRQGG